MTRENKLALVVGFALILVVGILVSDHFSTARSQQSAELGQVVDPTDPNALAGTRLIEYDSGPRAEPLFQNGRVDRNPTHADQTESTSPFETNGYTDVVRMPPSIAAVNDPLADQPPRPHEPSRTIELDDAARDAMPFTYHHVKPNETLTSICKSYFGDTSLVDELAEFNDIDDPNLVPAGRRLRIPKAAALVHGQQPTRVSLEQLEQLVSAGQTPPTPPRNSARTYTVQKGDTLGEIAQRLLGTSRRWRELYEFNKDVIKNPNTVVVGTKLKIPQ